MGTQQRPAELTDQQYAQACLELRAINDQMASMEVDVDAAATARLCFAITAIAFRQEQASRKLWAEGLYCESIANIRECFEAALTAGWLQQSGHPGVEALLRENRRQSDNLANNSDRAGMPLPKHVQELLTELGEDLPQTGMEDQRARNIEQRCLALEGGQGLYLIYRALCRSSHPASHAADYLAMLAPDLVIPTKEPNPKAAKLARAVGAYTVTVSLLWSLSACSAVQTSDPARARLDAVAKRLGVPSLLRRGG